MSLSLVPLFLVGLAGSVHCVGMCGGIVSAFSVTSAARAPFPVAVVTRDAAPSADGVLGVLAYNAGRIASYATAGAIAGGIAGGAGTLAGLAGWQGAAYWLANLMLVMLGLYLMDAWRGVLRLERLGQGLWRRLRPLMALILPLDGPAKMFALGALWGWLPCGMVYSVLLTAMLTGSAGGGVAVMVAFGLGTLPMLLLLGLAGSRLRQTLQRAPVRRAAGVIVLAFGLLGIARATTGISIGWLDVLCVTGASP
jgi:sulfite exporter TauE/SafE